MSLVHTLTQPPAPSQGPHTGSHTHTRQDYSFGHVDPGEFRFLIPRKTTFLIQKALFLRFCLFFVTTVSATLSETVTDPLSYLMGEPVERLVMGLRESSTEVWLTMGRLEQASRPQ